MELSEAQINKQSKLFTEIKNNGVSRNPFGVLPSNRAGKYWGRIVISKDSYIELGGTPRKIKGKLWVPVFIKEKKKDAYKIIDPALQYLSVESLYRVYGERFFSKVINPKLSYLAPVGDNASHVFELVHIVQFTGDEILVKNQQGHQRAISKLDFFSSNISLLHSGEFKLSLSLESMRNFYELGGKGEVVLFELNNAPQEGALVPFEGYYIRITQLPEFSFYLFSDREAYEMFKANDSVPLLYTFNSFFSGVNIPAGSPMAIDVSKRLGLEEASHFIGITASTKAATYVHERTHFNDNHDPQLGLFAEQVTSLIKNRKLPQQAYRLTWHAISEKRAYSAERNKLKESLGQSPELDEKIHSRFSKSKSDYLVLYFEPFAKLLNQLKKSDPQLAEFLRKNVNELCKGTEEVASPF